MLLVVVVVGVSLLVVEMEMEIGGGGGGGGGRRAMWWRARCCQGLPQATLHPAHGLLWVACRGWRRLSMHPTPLDRVCTSTHILVSCPACASVAPRGGSWGMHPSHLCGAMFLMLRDARILSACGSLPLVQSQGPLARRATCRG